MKTYIKKPELGEWIKCEDLGLTGRIVEVFNYQNTIEFIHPKQLKEENEKLRNELGNDYKKLYFECIIEIEETAEDSEYKGEKVAVIDWKQYQTCQKI